MSSATTTTVGRLTADPVLRRTPNDVPVVNFTVAHTPRRQADDGSWEDAGETLFLECTAWRLLAENVAASLSKGDPVTVDGVLGIRSYETDAGEKRQVVTCQASTVALDLRWATAVVTRFQQARTMAPVEEPAPLRRTA